MARSLLESRGISIRLMYDLYEKSNGIHSVWDVQNLLPHFGLGASHGNAEKLLPYLRRVGYDPDVGGEMDFNTFMSLVAMLIDTDARTLRQTQRNRLLSLTHVDTEQDELWDMWAQDEEGKGIPYEKIRDTVQQFDLTLEESALPRKAEHLTRNNLAALFMEGSSTTVFETDLHSTRGFSSVALSMNLASSANAFLGATGKSVSVLDAMHAVGELNADILSERLESVCSMAPRAMSHVSSWSPSSPTQHRHHSFTEEPTQKPAPAPTVHVELATPAKETAATPSPVNKGVPPETVPPRFGGVRVEYLQGKSHTRPSKKKAPHVRIRPLEKPLHTELRRKVHVDQSSLPEQLRQWVQGARLRTEHSREKKRANGPTYQDATKLSAVAEDISKSPLDYFYERRRAQRNLQAPQPFCGYRLDVSRVSYGLRSTVDEQKGSTESKSMRGQESYLATSRRHPPRQFPPRPSSAPPSRSRHVTCPTCFAKFATCDNFCPHCGRKVV